MLLTPATDGNVQIRLRQGTAQTKSKPDNPSQDSEQSDDWHEVASQDICEPLNWRPSRLTLTYNFDDLVKPGSIS